MSSSVNILKNMVSFDKAEQFDGFSKVVIIVSDEIEYSAGTDTGRTLTLNCPWGTQEIANNILQSIKGFQYQPMTAENALVDPSVEIGDGIGANGVYSGVYSLETKFNSNLPTTVSAPADEELYEEHTYVPKSEREVTRKFLEFQSQFKIQDGKISAEVEERKSDTKTIRATLEVQAGQITAKVNKNDGSSSTFGWALETASWRIFSGSNTVLKADKNGLEVKGVIRATSGEIGGFKITSNSLTYNNQTWGGTNSTGIYVGPQGIQCGSAERGIRLTNNGYLYAERGEFRGAVYAGRIEYDDEDKGRLTGSALEYNSLSGSRLKYNTVSTDYTSGGINTSLGYADRFYDATQGDYVSEWYTSNLYTARLFVDGDRYKPRWIYYTDSDGNATQTLVLAID